MLFSIFLLLQGAILAGAYLLGGAVNYLPLSLYAIVLYPPEKLETELAGIDDIPANNGEPDWPSSGSWCRWSSPSPSVLS